MINKITPVSVKNKTNAKTVVNEKPAENLNNVVSEPLIMKKESQTDTFVSTKPIEDTFEPKTNKGNGKLLAGVLSLMELINIALGSSSKSTVKK